MWLLHVYVAINYLPLSFLSSRTLICSSELPAAYFDGTSLLEMSPISREHHPKHNNWSHNIIDLDVMHNYNNHTWYKQASIFKYTRLI